MSIYKLTGICIVLILFALATGCSLLGKKDAIGDIEELIVANKYVAAYETCELALVENPDNVEIEKTLLYCEYKVDLHSNELKHIERIKELEKEAEKDKTGKSDFLLGYLFFQKKLPGLAIEHFEISKKKGYDVYLLDFYYAGSKKSIGDDKGAEEIYKSIINEKPEFLYAYTKLIELYLSSDKTDEAYEMITKGDDHLKKNRPYDKMYFLIMKYNYLKDLEKSEAMDEVIDKGINKLPSIYRTTALANIYISEEEYDKAIVKWSEFIEDHPEDSYGYYMIAYIYSAYLDKQKKAEENYIKAAEFAGEEPYYARAEIILYNRRGQDFYNELAYDEAIAEFEKVIQIKPYDSDTLREIGFCYLRKPNEGNKEKDANLDSATDYFNRIIKNCGDATSGYNGLASVYSRRDEAELAIKYYKEGLEINPYSTTLLSNLGGEYAKNDDFEEAEKCYKKVIKMDPNNEFVHLKLGYLYYDKKEYSVAVTELEVAVSNKGLEPTLKAGGLSILAWNYIFEELEATGKMNSYNPKITESTKEKALKAISDALAIDPKNEGYISSYKRIMDLDTKSGVEDENNNDTKADFSLKITATAGLNIRSGPDSSYDKLAKVEYQDKVKKLDEKNGWYKIRTNDGTVGWVCGGMNGEVWVEEIK